MSTGMVVLLCASLFIALAFEFVNGFHDTANAVATVIYTHTLKATPAVMLSGLCNFAGVFVGGIAVAMAIVHLLPVDLLVASQPGEGMAMVLALLVSAIVWNLGTWYFGLPASSSHTLIGSILGVGLANSAMNGRFGDGVNWDKALHVGESLLVSPIFGFLLAGGLLLLLSKVLRDKRVFEPPVGDAPPPGWIRGVLITTCAGVSFAHGSNDGQKGVGLIMLILIGLMPGAFAIDESNPALLGQGLEAVAELRAVLDGEALETSTPHLDTIEQSLRSHDSAADIPAAERWPIRVGILRIDDAIEHWKPTASSDAIARAESAQAKLDPITDYAPWWVIVAVALALGIGTTVGYKRIVVTVGEKIGKTHLTYAQGMSAELVAMSTIGVSSYLGLPVSTTHVLSSGIAGTMAAGKSGLQKSTVRSILLAWVLTLPVCMFLSAALFWVFSLFV